MIEVNDDTFEAEVLRSHVPVLVDFFADYCGPCRLLKPVLTALAERLGNTVKIVSADVVANEGLVHSYKIEALPTLVVFKNGIEVNRMIGLKDLHYLQEALAV